MTMLAKYAIINRRSLPVNRTIKLSGLGSRLAKDAVNAGKDAMKDALESKICSLFLSAPFSLALDR